MNSEDPLKIVPVLHGKPCNVIVIGGGTTGMEAACTVAEVRCTTFLLEKKPYLGGLAAEISKIPDKKRLADFPNYMIHRTNKLKNLFAFTNTDANVDFIKNLKPNIIVNATGSSPLLPPIPGLYENIDKEGGKVASILNMIDHVNDYPTDLKGKKVVVIGGGAVGLDVVEFFAPRGAEVSIVEIVNIGDSVRARRIIEGTEEGRNIIYVLKKREYL